jgi:hypothetical protein
VKIKHHTSKQSRSKEESQGKGKFEHIWGWVKTKIQHTKQTVLQCIERNI